MAAVPLPPGVEAKLRELAAGVRRMRVLRGACWLALVLILAPLPALALDAAFDLSGRARGYALAGWGAAVAAAAWWLVGRRLFGRVPPRVLARAVEMNYPSLAERLQTLVELNASSDPANGSKAMVQLLARDTERRTARLNFFAAAPRGFTLRLAVVAVVVALLAVAPLVALPGSGERVRRLVQPWHTVAAEPAFRVVVSSGHPTVRRGDAVTLAGYVERVKPGESVPPEAVVVVRDAGGAEKAFPMRNDGKATFTFTRPSVAEDFEYAIAVGETRSEWHAVGVVDPIRVAAGSGVTVSPPEYARAAVPAARREGLGEIEALQFSTAAFEVKFNLPVADAALEWRPAGTPPTAPPERIAVRLTADRTGAAADVPIRTDGVLRWVLEGAKGVRTEVPLAVRAVRDLPPRFERVAGFPGLAREVRPDEPLAFDVAVRDDVAISSVVLEYGRADVAGGSLPFSQALPLAGVGTPKAEGRVTIPLAGKFRDGESVVFRLRVRDTRSVPEGNLAPQEVTFPENGWATLKVTAGAKPLAEQEVRGQQTALHDRLAAVRAAVTEAAADLKTLRSEMAGRDRLAQDQSVRLANDRDRAGQCAAVLDDLARAAEVVPELAGVSTAGRAVADRHLRPAEVQLRKAGQEGKAPPRDAAADDAQKRLDAAVAALDALMKLNVETADRRLDAGKLAQLAAEQRALANDKSTDATTAAKRQDELRDRLRDALEKSNRLRDVGSRADAAETRALAERVRALRDSLAKLDAEARAAEEATGKKQLETVAREQKKLAEEVAELANRTEAAARLANAPPAGRTAADAARDLIDRQQSLDALTEQEKAARDLDRYADELSKAAGDRNDARRAAGQLERWQADIRRRLAEAETAHPDGVPDELRKKLRAEQTALANEVKKLSLPPSDELERLRRDTAERAGDAGDLNPSALEKSAGSLTELAGKVPSNEQRHKAAQGELERLRRDQDAVAREAAEAVRETQKRDPDDPGARDELAKKLRTAADRQAELARRVEALDTPGEEDRRGRAAAAARRAAEDFAKGLPQDIPASLRETKRQLDRLRDALGGTVPADRAAGELARLQNEVSDRLERQPAPAGDELQRLQRDQGDIQRRLAQLAAPEATGPLADARAAVREADAALRQPMPDVDELRKKNKAAADALRTLTDRLAGEPDRERLERLARNREVEADAADELAKKPADPVTARAAQDRARRDADDLADARAGEAQGTKRELQDVLDRLKSAPDAERAKDLQRQAATLARRLADQAKPASPAPAAVLPPAPTDPADVLPTEADAEAARALARKQRALREQLSRAATDKPDPAAEAARERVRKDHDVAAEEAGKLAGQLGQRPPGDERSREAGQAVKDAAGRVAGAAKLAAKGQAAEAAEERLKALDALKRASEALGPADGPPVDDKPPQPVADAARQAKDAEKAMAEAKRKLDAGQPARPTMTEAADKLKGAAEKLMPGKDAAPGPEPGVPEAAGPASADAAPSALAANLGKRWGDLPGEVRAQITQELKAKYGDDYARLIKLYFEQLAERK